MAKQQKKSDSKPAGDASSTRKRRNLMQVSGYPAEFEKMHRDLWREATDFRRGLAALSLMICDPALDEDERNRVELAAREAGRIIEQQLEDTGEIHLDGLLARILNALGREAIERVLE